MGIFSNLFLSSCASTDTLLLGCTNQETLQRNISFALIVAFVQTFLFFLGTTMGENILHYVEQIDHWIIFVVLGYFGVKSILESQEEIQSESSTHFILKSVAVSLDALALGVSLVGFIQLGIGFYIALFSVTFLSFLFGSLLAKKIPLQNYKLLKVCSGVLFIGLGLKILIFHLVDHGM